MTLFKKMSVLKTTSIHDEISANLHKIVGLRAAPSSRNVAIVTIVWHQKLVSWIKDPGCSDPGEINNEPLLANGELDIRKRFRIDFEIIEIDLWPRLVEFFTCKYEIIRKFSLHPVSNESTVVVSPFIIEMQTPSKTLTKTLAHDWRFSDIKNHLCQAVKLVRSDHVFISPKDNLLLSDEMTVADYCKLHGNVIRLVHKNSIKPTTTVPPVQILTSTLPRPTFGQVFSSEIAEKKAPSSGIRFLSSFLNIPKPIGLQNLGNTCFFNSSLQCIIRIKPLVEFMFSQVFEDSIYVNNKDGTGGIIAREFRNLLNEMSGTKSFVSPKAFHSIIVRKYPVFGNYGQHDAQEALGSFLDGIHEDVSRPMIEISETPRTTSIRKRYPSKRPSIIYNLFSGMLFSSIYCPLCTSTTTVYDPFFFLTLSIPFKAYGPIQLSDCLNSFTQSETLDENNKWECSHCNNKVCATKTMGIEKCSRYLIIHLKRFSYQGYKISKIDSNIEYPDKLEIRSYTRDDKGVYNLIGVVFHSGSIGFGHYTSVSLDPNTNQWYHYNDSFVSKVSIGFAHSHQAYILFYQRE